MKASEILTVSTTVTQLSEGHYKTAGGEKATKALIQVQGAGIRYWSDGRNPTTDQGIIINALGTITLDSYNEIKMFRVIRDGGSDATLAVSYA